MRRWQKEFLLAEKRADKELEKQLPFSPGRIKYLRAKWNTIVSQLAETEKANKKS